MLLKYYKLHPDAKVPYKAHEYDACYDVFVNLKGTKSVKTSYSHLPVEASPHIASLQYVKAQEIKDTAPVLGGDAYEEEYVYLQPFSSTILPTGIAYGIPEGYCMKFYPRSGLASKERIFLSNCVGIVDAGYKDQVYVMLTNLSGERKRINHHAKVCQFSLEKLIETELMEVDSQDSLQQVDSLRSGGLGSTGK